MSYMFIIILIDLFIYGVFKVHSESVPYILSATHKCYQYHPLDCMYININQSLSIIEENIIFLYK